MQSISSEKFCSQVVLKEQLQEIVEVIDTFPNLSRTERNFSISSGNQ